MEAESPKHWTDSDGCIFEVDINTDFIRTSTSFRDEDGRSEAHYFIERAEQYKEIAATLESHAVALGWIPEIREAEIERLRAEVSRLEAEWAAAVDAVYKKTLQISALQDQLIIHRVATTEAEESEVTNAAN